MQLREERVTNWDADTLRVVTQLYDEIWASIAHNYADERRRDEVRSKLAQILLDLAREGNLAPEQVALATEQLR